MHILMRFALEKQRERERENNISLALVVEKDKRWRRERKENFCVRDDDERKAKRKTFVRFVYEKWPHEYYSKFFLRNNLHVLNRMSSAKDDRDDDNTIDEDEIDDWLDSDDDDGTKKEADEAMPVEDNNNDAVMKQQEQQQLVRETKMKEEEEEEEEAKREHEDQERKNRERAELEACQAAEITAARKKHEARIRESEKQEEAAKVQRAAAEAAAKEEEEREARHKLEVEKREREEFTMKARAQAEAVELKARREAESAVERVRIEEEEEEEEEEEGEQQQQQRQEEEEEEEEERGQQQQAQQQQQQQERGQQQREKELETPKAVFEADKSEQPHASTHIDAVGERETAYPDHQGQNEFDDLAQSSTIVGSLFGGLKALKSAASKTVTTVKTHEFTRQMTSDIRELSRHIAGDDVASSSKTKGTTTTTHGENVQNQQGRTRQSTRDEVDALEIAEKLASKTWHAIGDFTTKGKKLANDVEGSIREKGVGATAEKYGKNALFGIEKVLSNATKVITAGIEDGTNGTSRLAENLQEYGVFEYLDSIDMNTKEAEESFKALDSEAANFMAKACADILSPHVSDEIGSPLKINTNQEFEEMDIHLHEAETSPVKKSGKIHAKKIIDLVQRIRMLLKEVMEKPEQNPTKKALSLIEIAESELESTRESIIVGFTELTILACQKFEKVSEELHPKNKMDVSVWGSTVESRAKYVETEIGRIENEMRSFRNVVANEVEALNTISVEQVGEVNISNIPTVSEVVSSFIENVDDDLLECFNIFEDAKGMIIPSIVVSCL